MLKNSEKAIRILNVNETVAASLPLENRSKSPTLMEGSRISHTTASLVRAMMPRSACPREHLLHPYPPRYFKEFGWSPCASFHENMLMCVRD